MPEISNERRYRQVGLCPACGQHGFDCTCPIQAVGENIHDQYAAKCQEIESLKRTLAFLNPEPLFSVLQGEIDEAMDAVNKCLMDSNGREKEWGPIAVHALGHLHKLCIVRQERRMAATNQTALDSMADSICDEVRQVFGNGHGTND